MTLRAFGYLLIAALITAGAGAGIALMKITDYLHGATEKLGVAIESVYQAEELELALVLHDRDVFLAGLTGMAQYQSDAIERERAIDLRLEAYRKLMTTPAEVEQLKVAEPLIMAYLEDRRRLQRDGVPPLEAFRQVSNTLDVAYRAIERLVQINRDDALTFRAQASRQNEKADYVGMAVIASMTVLLGGVAMIGGRAILRPLVSLCGIVRTFGRGALETRFPQQGLAEIREIGTAFNEMAERLSRSRESQVRFLASIAHDLRNPLGAIKMSADLLAMDATLDAAERRQMLDVISRQASRLDAMVGDLLDVAKSESGQLRLHIAEHDLRQLTLDAVRLYENASKNHDVATDLPESPVPCRCDGGRVSQVLNNLLSNAIKYTPYGGTIRVKLRCDADTALISVMDQGIGIEPAEVGSIFEPFRRSKATQDLIPGVGLGLATSKKIVERHGGRIEVESEKGKGSTFRIRLPLQAGAESRPS